MKPITTKQKETLEKILGYKICPLTVKVATEPIAFYFPIEEYECAVDGGRARGGQQTLSGAITPCSKEYAKTCPLYKNHKARIQYLFENPPFLTGEND